MADENMKKIMGGVILGVVCTALSNDVSLNLSGLVKTFVTLASWVPLAFIVGSLSK